MKEYLVQENESPYPHILIVPLPSNPTSKVPNVAATMIKPVPFKHDIKAKLKVIVYEKNSFRLAVSLSEAFPCFGGNGKEPLVSI